MEKKFIVLIGISLAFNLKGMDQHYGTDLHRYKFNFDSETHIIFSSEDQFTTLEDPLAYESPVIMEDLFDVENLLVVEESLVIDTGPSTREALFVNKEDSFIISKSPLIDPKPTINREDQFIQRIKRQKRIHRNLISDLITPTSLQQNSPDSSSPIDYTTDWTIFISILSAFYDYCNAIHGSLQNDHPIKRKLSRVAACSTYIVARFHYSNNRPEVAQSILDSFGKLKDTSGCQDICDDIRNLLIENNERKNTTV